MFQVMFALFIKLVGIFAGQSFTEPINGAQLSAQAVRNRVREGLQLFVDHLKLSGAFPHFLSRAISNFLS